jgi:hypothetical protein
MMGLNKTKKQRLKSMEEELPKSSFPGSITDLRLLSSLLLDDIKGSTDNRPGVRLLGGAAPLLGSLSVNILQPHPENN